MSMKRCLNCGEPTCEGDFCCDGCEEAYFKYGDEFNDQEEDEE